VSPTGQQCGILGCNAEQNGNAIVRNIVLAVPPVPPTGVKASQTDGKVDLVWNANNIEGDLLGYQVDRDIGAGKWRCLRVVALDPKKPATYKANDIEDLSEKADGDYQYRVRAMRAVDSDTKLGTCTAPAGIPSATAASKVSWKNPNPPTTTTTALGGGGGGGGGGTTTTVPKKGAGDTSGTAGNSRPPNLSALGSLGVPSNLASPPRVTAPGEVDPGFNELLPFSSSGGEDPCADSGSALPSDPTTAAGDKGNGTTTLLFVAAGLLATVLAGHVLWLKAQVDRMPLEPLPPQELPPLGPLGG
jgi:hypothetical protein